VSNADSIESVTVYAEASAPGSITTLLFDRVLGWVLKAKTLGQNSPIMLGPEN
jgi:hypothetical protein